MSLLGLTVVFLCQTRRWLRKSSRTLTFEVSGREIGVWREGQEARGIPDSKEWRVSKGKGQWKEGFSMKNMENSSLIGNLGAMVAELGFTGDTREVS